MPVLKVTKTKKPAKKKPAKKKPFFSSDEYKQAKKTRMQMLKDADPGYSKTKTRKKTKTKTA